MEQADADSHTDNEPQTARTGVSPALRWLLPATLVSGALGDLLLRALPYGLNAAVWATAVLACAVVLLYRRQERLSAWAIALIVSSWLFAVCFAWRDGVYLKWLAVCCWLASAALAAGAIGGFPPACASFLEYLATLACGTVKILFGGWHALTAANPREWRVNSLRKPWVSSAILGVVLAVPILAVFGVLLISADRAFGQLISRLFSFDLQSVRQHVVAFGVSAWIGGGLLAALIFGVVRHAPNEGILRSIRVGGVETGIVFGAVDMLFFAFVTVQFQYFFGGSGRVETVADLTYSEYARHGFFELCAVTALTLLLQYFFHWLMRDRGRHEKVVCRLLSVVQLLLVGVIMVSALMRMNLYIDAYGLTQLRFYSTAFMLWIGFSLAWFAVTALWGRAKRFMVGMVVSGMLLVLAFHAVNPGGIIVSWNLARTRDGKPFDAAYALSLGADAVPGLVAAIGELDERDAERVRLGLGEQWEQLRDAGWRTWNWSRGNAARALETMFGDGASHTVASAEH
ncbi:MAG TPA: DUF4173 domain-containing protein [Candidatus Hydrogenedentes bacterium]|nr:DUF4173 domain-containing protein [Candidatus Hydrogenedentota bacterium]